MNPQKGYYATANNRIMPENSRFDIGATGTITPRAKRITEIIDKGIKSGQRFTS
jgi:penicillin amidase